MLSSKIMHANRNIALLSRAPSQHKHTYNAWQMRRAARGPMGSALLGSIRVLLSRELQAAGAKLCCCERVAAATGR